MTDRILCTVATALGKSTPIVQNDHDYAVRVLNHQISAELCADIRAFSPAAFGVTDYFKKVVDDFKVAPGETPAGYRVEYKLGEDNVLRADLHRDISYEKNGL